LQKKLPNGKDEIREAYYVFSHLGCDEQILGWDLKGGQLRG